LFDALDRTTKQADESRQDAPTALPMVAAPSIAPDAVAPLTEPASVISNVIALAAAVALAGVAAFFSITGKVEVFPVAPLAVIAFAGSMEAGKLIIAGWLAANWSVAQWKLRNVLVALVINAVGVFGNLVEAHVTVAATARSGVSERMQVVDPRLISQSATIANLDRRISALIAGTARVEVATGPVRYLVGSDAGRERSPRSACDGVPQTVSYRAERTISSRCPHSHVKSKNAD
jgi:hypothetical protein